MNKLLVIVGPTGAGKTRAALKLARKYQTEIISADSRQVYKGMDIGTGKEVEELKEGNATKVAGGWVVNGVRINLYDTLDPKENFSVAQFQQEALRVVNDLQKQDKLPILVGGTGLYISAIVDGLKVPNIAPNLEFRAKLEKLTLEDLVEMLKKYDPKSFDKVDLQNPRRIIRALEVFEATGKSLISLQRKYKPGLNTLQIGLTAPREILYQRADKQVDLWFEQGFVGEVRDLLTKGYSQDNSSMSSIGYRQVQSLLEGNLSEDEAKQRIKFDRHGYIRRQLGWFKRDGRINWFDVSREDFYTELENLVDTWYNSATL